MSQHTIILRHRKENIKKCSLSGLEEDPNFTFFRYPTSIPSHLTSTILLTLDAPLLSYEDRHHNLLLIDGTWRYAAKMEQKTKECNPLLIPRTLPHHIKTAYPRKQTDCSDEKRGLASIEALAIAHLILGWPWLHLLDRYHWKDAFIGLNQDFIEGI